MGMHFRPDFTDYYYHRGRAYQALEQHSRSIQDFDAAIRLTPDMAEAYYFRGLTYEQLGKKFEAGYDFKESARLGNLPAKELLNTRGKKW